MRSEESIVCLMTEVHLKPNNEHPNVSIWLSRTLFDNDQLWEDQKDKMLCLAKDVEQVRGIQLADCIEKGMEYIGIKVDRDEIAIP